jgi:hypothetical protein
LLRGVQVCRNDNYSIDSYSKDESEASDSIIIYTLNKQRNEVYPETEWFAIKKIIARFELLMRGGPVLEVWDGSTLLGSTEHQVHNVVIESDLLPPPPMAEHQLSSEDKYTLYYYSLRSYRLDRKALTMTNIDRKNPYFALSFTEVEKKELLINKIV